MVTIARRRVTSAGGLQALGHPVRLALLELLGAEGPKTASQAAIVLGQSPSNCSWHLRKLAQHGFVREVRGATGRERPWQVVTEGLTWADDETAGEGVEDVLLERDVQRLRAARAAGDREPEEWRDATGVEQRQVWLTASEANELRAEIANLLARYDEHREGTRRVSAVAWIVPTAPYERST
jgi:DNA-binding transcriptional ArsR family regulator